MRVGLVIYGSLGSLSGGYLYDRKLVEYLRAQGDSVQVISQPSTNYAGAILQNASSKFRKQLLKLEVDILLQDELNHPSLFLLNGWLRSRVTYPLIGIVHHLRSNEKHPGWVLPLYRAVERRHLRSLDGFIFNSHSTQREVAALAPHSRPFVIATPGGDALDGKSPDQETNAHSQLLTTLHAASNLEIIFVGNLIERKGLHTLLEALGTMAQNDWHLRVVGRTDIDPGYTRRRQNQTVQLGLSSKVEFLGASTDTDLVYVYQTSQLLVVPSSFEGFGIVYLEAMRWGVVPIATATGGATEIIQNGKNGWLVAPGDTDGLAAILKNACENPETLQNMRQAARQRFADFPTWTQTAETIRKFLLSLL